ncbi:MAG: sterol desaturase family protein [Marinagarivorans sp.]
MNIQTHSPQPANTIAGEPKPNSQAPAENYHNPSLGQRWLKKLCYPLLLLSVAVCVFCGFTFKLNYGLCNMAFLAWAIFYLALCERIIPYKIQWHPSSTEWARDGIYLVLTLMGGGLATGAVYAGVAHIAPLHASFALWAEVALALLLSSLGSYIFHRAGHEIPWLWRFHSVHHAAEKINVSNNALNHIFDVFGRRILALLPLALLGFSQPALFIVGVFNTAQGYFAHANVDVRLGIFNYCVGGPEQHRLHHSMDVQEAGHFSVDIPLWDFLLRSYTWKPGRVPAAIGIKYRMGLPPSNAIIASLLYPFQRAKKRPAINSSP